jgi:hypothetical protein
MNMEKIPTYYCSQCGVRINDGKELIAGGYYKFLDERTNPWTDIVTCGSEVCHDKVEFILRPNTQNPK